MSRTKDLTVRERLVRAGILLPAPRRPEPGEMRDEPRRCEA